MPFWVHPKPEGDHIERHVSHCRLSRELDQVESLRSALAVYPLALDQARQDDLVAPLIAHLGQAGAAELAAKLRIDLRPRLSVDSAAA